MAEPTVFFAYPASAAAAGEVIEQAIQRLRQRSFSAFKARVAEAFRKKKPAAISQSAGPLSRFVHEIKRGGLVVYPSKRHRQIHLGRMVAIVTS